MNMAWNFDKLLLPTEACKNGGYTASSLVVNTALAFVLQGIDKYVLCWAVVNVTLLWMYTFAVHVFTGNTYQS